MPLAYIIIIRKFVANLIYLNSMCLQKSANPENFSRLFPASVRPYASFVFGFRFPTPIVFPGVNPSPNPRVKFRVRVRVRLGSLPG